MLGLVALRPFNNHWRQRFVRWLLHDLHLGEVKFGDHSCTLGALLHIDTQVPTVLGDIGMNAATGRPQIFVDAAARDVLGGHETVKTDGSNALTADWGVGSHKITGLADGASGTQSACTVAQMEAAVAAAAAGLSWDDPVIARTAAALPLYTRAGNKITANVNGAFPQVDGVTITSDGVAGSDNGTEGGSDHILLHSDHAVDGKDTGIYYLSDPGDAGHPWVLTRRSGFVGGDHVANVTFATIKGTVYHDLVYRVTNDAPNDAVNTDALVIGPFGGMVDHGSTVGLADDDHTQYALLVGRAGGTTIIGGTAASDDIELASTSHGTKGKIKFKSGSNLEFGGDDQYFPASDGQGSFGDATHRFKQVYGVSVVSGDHSFVSRERGVAWTMTEEPDGIYMVNRNTGSVHKLLMSAVKASDAERIVARVMRTKL
jgi:hypothetical protein